MTIELINIGQTPNDQQGDPLRTAFTKVNKNFETLASSSLPGGPDGAVQYRATNNLSAIALQSGTYVATGFPGRVFVSTDLTTWTAATSPVAATLVALTTDTQLFIGVGASGTVATSFDGEFWQNRPTGAADDLLGVAFGNGIYIAVGVDGTILRSVDSQLWTIITSQTAETLTSVVYSAGQGAFVAVGTSGTIITSVDGNVWDIRNSGIVEDLNSVTAYSNQVLIAGNAGRILESLDLYNWNIRTSGTLENLLGITTAVLATTATAFAVGANGTIVTSSDSGFIIWNDTTYASPTTKTLTTVAGLDATVVTIGEGGTIFTTTGGSWSDTGIPSGLAGSSRLVFNPQASTLSIDASITPQSNATWNLGTNNRRWTNGYFSANVTIGAVTLQSDATTFRPLLANGAISNIDVTNAQAVSVTATNATFGNVSTNSFVAQTITTDAITVDDITANSVQAAYFTGNGGNLTGLPVQSIVAGANITVANVGGQWTISSTSNGGDTNTSRIFNGTSNVEITAPSGNVTVGVNGVANVLTITNTATVANTFRANTFTLGNATTTACSTTWHKLQTSTVAPNQVLLQLPAGTQISTDFKVITYDMTASTRQSSMITTVTYGSGTSYSEYARTVINTVIADFSVDQVGGQIRLLVSPRAAHIINYTIIVSTY